MSSNLVNKIIFESTLKEVGELKNFSFDFKGPFKYGLGNYRYNYLILNEEVYFVIDVFFENLSSNEFFKDNFQNYPFKETIYNISYTLNGDQYQDKKTTLKQLNEILSTNLKIILDFISKHNPDILLVIGNHKTNLASIVDDSQKSKLYGAIIDKQINKIDNYDYSIATISGERNYIIYKV